MGYFLAFLDYSIQSFSFFWYNILSQTIQIICLCDGGINWGTVGLVWKKKLQSLALRVSRPCLAMGKQTDRSVSRKQPVEIFRKTDNRTDRSLAKKQDQELPFKNKQFKYKHNMACCKGDHRPCLRRKKHCSRTWTLIGKTCSVNDRQTSHSITFKF